MADDQAQPHHPAPPPDDGRQVRVPEPRIRRRTSARSVVFSLFATLFAVVLVAAGVAVWGLGRALAPGPLPEARAIVIERGSGNEDIAALLEKEGVIDNARQFLALTWLTKYHAPVIKAGEYEFTAGISMRDALALMRSGRAITYKLTLPEGWTSERIMERIRAHPALSGEITRKVPEGSLLPDTYLFQRGMSRNDLIAQMQGARDRLVEKLWAARAAGLPVKTPDEAVILASIVEKETGLAEERPRVAAVFVNRLKRHMRLQSDPTIIYGITGGKSRLDRPLRRSDIAAVTPYNTYQIDGLPPTPIANPGREALEAVLNPQTSGELYFVADGSGGHVFAKTLKGHQANVKRWRQVERDQREAAAAAADADSETAVDVAQKPATQADVPAPSDLAIPDESAGTGKLQAKAQEQAAIPPAPEQTTEAEVAQAAETPIAEPPQPVEATKAEVSRPSGESKPTETLPAFAEITDVEPGKVVKVADRLVPFPRSRPVR